MWIENLPNGKYKYCERYTDTKGKTKKVSVTLDKNTTRAQNEAIRLLFAKIEQKNKKQEIEDEKNDISKITFYDVMDQFYEINSQTVKAKTNKLKRSIKNRIMEYIPKEMLLIDTSSNFLSNIIEDVYYKKNFSYSYAYAIKSTLNQIFDYAISKDYLSENPMSRVKIKKKVVTFKDREKNKNKYLENDELKHVLYEMSIINKQNSLMLEFMALTGLRFGECVGLTVDNIRGNIITVNGTWDEVSQSKTTTKNIYSDRKVQVTERCLEIINERLKYNKAKGKNVLKKDTYIFSNERGVPLTLNNINFQLKKVKSDKQLTTHIFRHTHIAMLTELGIPLKAIMERVGHNNPQTTLSIYSHVTEKMSDNILKKLNKIDLRF